MFPHLALNISASEPIWISCSYVFKFIHHGYTSWVRKSIMFDFLVITVVLRGETKEVICTHGNWHNHEKQELTLFRFCVAFSISSFAERKVQAIAYHRVADFISSIRSFVSAKLKIDVWLGKIGSFSSEFKVLLKDNNLLYPVHFRHLQYQSDRCLFVCLLFILPLCGRSSYSGVSDRCAFPTELRCHGDALQTWTLQFPSVNAPNPFTAAILRAIFHILHRLRHVYTKWTPWCRFAIVSLLYFSRKSLLSQSW